MKQTLPALFLDDSGQGLVEYSLIIALMALVIVAALSKFGGANNTGITNSANEIPE